MEKCKTIRIELGLGTVIALAILASNIAWAVVNVKNAEYGVRDGTPQQN